MIGKAVKYLSDVRTETAKVIWPSKAELRGSAVIVIILSLLLAVFVFFIDQIASRLLKLIICGGTGYEVNDEDR